MSRDYGEMEQEFIAGLKADTGRDLADWMAAIDAQTFGHRNDMIDWLRQQNFTFSKASWLERIHHNGGKPVYGERTPAKMRESHQVKSAAGPPNDATVTVSTRPASKAEVPLPPPLIVTQTSNPMKSDALASFLAKAKGYRPLAEMLLRQIHNAAPGTVIEVYETHASLGAPRVYGALALTAKDIRLTLDLGELPFAGDIKRLRLPGAPANLMHTIVLNDARRVNYELMSLITVACKRANP